MHPKRPDFAKGPRKFWKHRKFFGGIRGLSWEIPKLQIIQTLAFGSQSVRSGALSFREMTRRAEGILEIMRMMEVMVIPAFCSKRYN